MGEDTDVLSIVVHDRVLHSVDRRLFGQFVERPSWGGEMGVEAAVVPGTSDLQPQAEQLIAEMRIPVLRFPGGSDVDYLDWTDMIDNVPGRGQERPVSAPRGNRIANHFGYDEFLRMADRNGSQTILVLGFRDALLGVRKLEGAAGDAAALVAYCNASLDQRLPPALAAWPKLRARNGHPEPYRVTYFQIGNETWYFKDDVEKIAPEDPDGHWVTCLGAYIKAIRTVDPTVKIIVDGAPLSVAAAIHREFGKQIHAYAIHRYHPWGISRVQRDGEDVDVSRLTAEEIWNAWVAVPAVDASGQAALEDEHFAQARELGYPIAMTEWNWNGWWSIKDGEPALNSQFAKGIGAASFLHAIMREGDLVRIGTQSLLIGNRWGIAGIRVDPNHKTPAFMMPTAMVSMIYSQHHGDEMLAVELAGMGRYQQPYKMAGLGPSENVAYVDVVATRSATALTVSMINRRFDTDQVVHIDCSAFPTVSDQASLTSLQGRLENRPDPDEPRAPGQVRHETRQLTGRTMRLRLPPRSITVVEFQLKQD